MATKVVENLLGLDGEELANYVRDRVIDLEISANDKEERLPVVKEGFISKKTEIKPGEMFFVGYCMEGIDYLAFAKYIKESKDSDITSLIIRTGNYVKGYFDYDVYAKREDTRADFLLDLAMKELGTDDWIDVVERGYVASINCLRNIGQAVCIEHSVLMQNLLSFLGIDVTCLSMISLEDAKFSGHSANVIHVSTGEVVKHLYYDLINMEVTKNGDRTVLMPTVKLISDEDYVAFLNGAKPLIVERQNCFKKDGKFVTQYFPKTIKNIATLQKTLG